MLARANRVVLAGDFRTIVRRGRRTATRSAVYHRMPTGPERPLRVGVIVARTVGGAVDRNRVRRRFRALARELVDSGHAGEDVVIRALPGSAQLPWGILWADMHSVLDSPVPR